jgi:hypothetical protein
MKIVEAFEADDGTIFNKKSDCIAYEEKIMFGKWYIDHQLYFDKYENQNVYLDDVIEWLKENREIIFRFLQSQ